jgi:hypothetical protein
MIECHLQMGSIPFNSPLNIFSCSLPYSLFNSLSNNFAQPILGGLPLNKSDSGGAMRNSGVEQRERDRAIHVVVKDGLPATALVDKHLS